MVISNFHWDTNVAAMPDDTLIPDGPLCWRYLIANIPALFGSEHHTFPTGSNIGAWHLPGSANIFVEATAPTARVDAQAFDITDNGRPWYDTTNKLFKVLTDFSIPTWTEFPSIEGDNTFTGDNTFSGETTITNGPGLMPVGSLTPFAGSAEPTGWLFCDGDEVSQTTYAALYAILGADAYGTDAGGNFFLPDMRGRVALGVGTGDASDATAHTLADKEGTETHKLLHEESGVAVHKHAIGIGGGTSATKRPTGDADGNQDQYTAQTDNVSGVDAAQAHNNLQPSLTLNYIIKY